MSALADFAVTPWLAPPLHLLLSGSELDLLISMARDVDGFGPGIAASIPGRRHPTQTALRSLHHLGVIEFTDSAAGGWDPGTWLARLTALGANAAFRAEARTVDGQRLDAHLGCGGWWLPDGTCTGCRGWRPLDAEAYTAMLTAVPAQVAAREAATPRLWCIEHGRLRHDQFTTAKSCRLNGTHRHDGGLYRI